MLALCGVVVLFAGTARADVVELTGGTRLEGDVLESGETRVRLLLPAGDELTIAKADVRSVTIDPDGPGGGHFTRYSREGKNPGLQVGVAHYEKPGAPRVDLVGVVHVADAAYYREIQALLDHEEVVLFEMVRNQDEMGEKRPAHSADPAVQNLSALRKFQQTLGTLLDLTFQTDGIDYRRRHFVHADMTLDEFMAEGGDRFSKELADQMARMTPFLDLISKAFDPNDVSEGAKKRMAFVRSMVKPLLGNMLGSMGDRAGVVLGGVDFDELIVTKRNAVAMAMFDAVVRSRDAKSIAIFYGSAHMPDFEKSLLERGWSRAGGRWLTAWSTVSKPEKPEKPATAPAGTAPPTTPPRVPTPAMN